MSIFGESLSEVDSYALAYKESKIKDLEQQVDKLKKDRDEMANAVHQACRMLSDLISEIDNNGDDIRNTDVYSNVKEVVMKYRNKFGVSSDSGDSVKPT